MKALVCGLCFDIRALDPTCQWTKCRCGNTEARWLNPHAGTVSVRAKDRSKARVLGMNNDFLIDGVHNSPTGNAAWKLLHRRACNAPGYIFDEGKRGCWACIVQVGETADITWEPEAPEENKA